MIQIRQRRLLAKREERWAKSYNAYSQVVKDLQAEEADENRRAVRIGVIVGILLHIVLFIIVFPEVKERVYSVGKGTRVYKMKQFRFQPPKQTQTRQAAPTKKTRRIPIPDPTPDDPEPFEHEDMIVPEVDFMSDQGYFEGTVNIPEGPPGPSTGIFQISGNVMAPERIFAPDPVYPEEARQARVQGVVILQTIINALGKVTDIKVLKGLPSGLTEAAVNAVSQWEFRPATLEGKPVAVYYMVTISFSVQ